MEHSISGFSKLNKTGKIDWLENQFFAGSPEFKNELFAWQQLDANRQQVIESFAENTIGNFPLPYCVAPNFLIDGKVYAVPMVIEESSVVAAASSAAKFWLERGGFHSIVTDTKKVGQVHFLWKGPTALLVGLFPALKQYLLQHTTDLTHNMNLRGGGILGIDLLDFTVQVPFLYQLKVDFETCDSMGANFINSVLEHFAQLLKEYLLVTPGLADTHRDVDVIMSILSNYTPECLVHVWVECPIEYFEKEARKQNMDATHLAQRFETAVRIAQIDPYRAATHNKGIFNGIDAVILATGNDFRAVEAGGHVYAARDGSYRSLSSCKLENNSFRFEMKIPLAIGTVGGLTKLHPLAKISLEMLGNPAAKTLMSIIGAVGLAQNFAAVRSLITTGIQAGHMKMHLSNMLLQLNASQEDALAAREHFENRPVSFNSLRTFLEQK
jgi:hydroxymethylglutaryl-CoA reductase